MSKTFCSYYLIFCFLVNNTFLTLANLMDIDEYVVVQFYPWFKFYFRLSWLFVMYDNEF